MDRPHSLLKYKKAQFVLAKVLSDLSESESNDPNYHLDMDFDREVNALLERYGYDHKQAIAVIKRHKALSDSLRTAPDGVLAQAYSGKLSLQRKRTGKKALGILR